MLIKGRILARQGKYAEALEALSKGKTYCVGLSMAGTDSQPPDEQHLKAINDELVKIRRAPSAGSFPQ
jgi:hypothetical protein